MFLCTVSVCLCAVCLNACLLWCVFQCLCHFLSHNCRRRAAWYPPGLSACVLCCVFDICVFDTLCWYCVFDTCVLCCAFDTCVLCCVFECLCVLLCVWYLVLYCVFECLYVSYPACGRTAPVQIRNLCRPIAPTQILMLLQYWTWFLSSLQCLQ